MVLSRKPGAEQNEWRACVRAALGGPVSVVKSAAVTSYAPSGRAPGRLATVSESRGAQPIVSLTACQSSTVHMDHPSNGEASQLPSSTTYQYHHRIVLSLPIVNTFDHHLRSAYRMTYETTELRPVLSFSFRASPSAPLICVVSKSKV